MTKFWELFERSVILQAALTLLFASVICYLLIAGRPVPDIAAYSLSTIIGFYFGSKTVTEASHQAQKLRERDKEV